MDTEIEIFTKKSLKWQFILYSVVGHHRGVGPRRICHLCDGRGGHHDIYRCVCLDYRAVYRVYRPPYFRVFRLGQGWAPG